VGTRYLKRSFSGGEVTPELYGRPDLPKIQEALALCSNFIALPHGPAVNRPGTEYIRAVKDSTKATRLIPFSFNNTQSFAIELGVGYFRFHTNAATLLAGTLPAYIPSATITVTIAAPGVVTWTAHGMSNGDPVAFTTTGALPTGITAGVTYYVTNAATDTFELASYVGGPSITTSGTQSGVHTGSRVYSQGDAVLSGGTNYYCVLGHTNQAPPSASYWYAMPATGEYEIPNAYAEADLMAIHYTQSADVLTLTHPNYPITELRRYGATTWLTSTVSFSPTIQAPSGSGTAGATISYGYKVSVIYDVWISGLFTGKSTSAASASAAQNNDLSQAGAYNTVTWSPSGTLSSGIITLIPVAYQVYRSIAGGTYYYIGDSSGVSFVDDSSRGATSTSAPAIGVGSAPTGIAVVATTAAGFSTVTATPTGTGAVSYDYVATAMSPDGSESYTSNNANCSNDITIAGQFNTITVPSVAGAIRYRVYKKSNGIYGYIGQLASGTNTFIDDNIVADISITPPTYNTVMSAAGDYPSAVAYYQGRRLFGGTTNEPQNVWATRSGTESDMSYTIPTRDDNRIAFRVAGREASAIRHIVPLQELLLLSASCEWRCSSTTGVLTPTTINVQPQSYVGASNVQPVVVGNSVLYGAARGGHVRNMNYNWQINGYESLDASIFAPHLFDYNSIVDMAYSRGPIPILWCVSSTGSLLGMTWLPEQKISAWHQHSTGASDAFESICTITENDEDMLYAVVRRTINGGTVRYVERLHTRQFTTLADAFYVDCGVTYNATTKSGTFTLSGTTLSCTMTAHGLVDGSTYWFYFSDATYGSLPGGSSYRVTVSDVDHFTIEVTTAASASGTVTWLPSTVSGLTWLEGSTVNILADGAVLPQQVVTGGALTFPVGVTKAQIGIPITAQMKTLPLAQEIEAALLQGRVKNVNKVFMRMYRASGIKAGQDFNDLTQYTQRSIEPYGNPPALVSDEIEIVLDNDWFAGGEVCLQQDDPLPIDLISMTIEVAIGGGI